VADHLGVLGLVPLLLAVTGLSTWLWTRGVRKRRRRRAAADAAGGVAVVVSVRLHVTWRA
jgi:hypothetical protein